ncbi:MAG: hypothetical protein EHM36_08440, partial [Deltaproteobacteria bacterium]
MLRKTFIPLFIFIIILFFNAPAFPAPSLHDYAFYVNGDLYVRSFPAAMDASGFDPNTGLGTLVITFQSLPAGNYSFRAFFDHEIQETINGFDNEYGGYFGSPAPGQTWEIGEPGYQTGSVYNHFLSGSLTNSNGIPVETRDDVSMAMGWDFALSAGQTARIRLFLTSQTPSSSFYLTHTDPESEESIYFFGELETDSETITPPSTPAGPIVGITGASYAYSTGGASTSFGHTVEYQFDWNGDGTSDLSFWGSSFQSKTWTGVGTYQVRARARCVTDPGLLSTWSEPLTVLISPSSSTYFVVTNPAGLQVVIDGVMYTTPVGFEWSPGSTHTIEGMSPQDNGMGTRYVFGLWSDGGAQSHTVTAPSSPYTCTGSFTIQYRLVTTVEPAGSGEVVPGGTGWYGAGQGVGVEARPNAGYRFRGWGGDITGTQSPTTVTLNGPMS